MGVSLRSLPGKACETEGAVDDSAAVDCDAGYYCRLGSPSSTPTETSCSDNEKTACLPGARCPVGYFCPKGSSAPQGCPLGTTGTTEGATSTNDCLSCPAGHFCPPGGGQWPCHAGFECLGGASTPRPTDRRTGKVCPKGSYCSAGAPATLCAKGTYADVEVSVSHRPRPEWLT